MCVCVCMCLGILCVHLVVCVYSCVGVPTLSGCRRVSFSFVYHSLYKLYLYPLQLLARLTEGRPASSQLTPSLNPRLLNRSPLDRMDTPPALIRTGTTPGRGGAKRFADLVLELGRPASGTASSFGGERFCRTRLLFSMIPAVRWVSLYTVNLSSLKHLVENIAHAPTSCNTCKRANFVSCPRSQSMVVLHLLPLMVLMYSLSLRPSLLNPRRSLSWSRKHQGGAAGATFAPLCWE